MKLNPKNKKLYSEMADTYGQDFEYYIEGRIGDQPEKYHDDIFEQAVTDWNEE